MEHLEHKKEKRNERAAIQLGLFLVGLLLFGTVAGGQLTGKEKNGKEKAAIQTSGGVSDAAEPKKIALTFDDGPHPVYTKKLLKGLKERGVKATFFLIGENIEGNEDLVRQMAEDGHLIGNHTWSHVDITKMSDSQACQEITKTSELVKSIVGYDTEYIRPPFGAWNKNLECGFEMFPVLWTIDPLDWKTENTGQIVKQVVAEAKENAVILLHDRYESSVEAAFQIIDILKKQGYEFVTADKLVLE